MRIHVGVSLLVALILVGCASQPPGTRPDDMSASEHNDHAAAHEVQAKKHEAAYDPNAVASRPTSTTSQNFAWGTETYNPTAVHLEHAKQHHEVAEAHHKAAHALETFTEAECSEFPPKTRALCPLMSVVAAEADIEGGAKLTLKPGVPIQAVLAHMRCHHAFARHQGHEGMPGCPLYLKNLEFAVDGNSVTITSDDAATVNEIRKRSREHVGK